MINTLIMCSNQEKNENIIINASYSPPDQGKREIDVRDINMEKSEEIIEELDRLKTVRLKWNINADPKPPPLHIKWEDYGSERRKEYRAAKDAYYRDYTKTCQDLNDNIKKLGVINTELCFNQKKIEDEIKIKEGTFYNAEEREYLNKKIEERVEGRKETNAKYYDKNKDKITAKRKIKKLEATIQMLEEAKDENIPHLVKSTTIIKPLCSCGRLCDVTKLITIKKHSNINKHKIFKSVIKLIHWRRTDKKIKPIIKKINNDYNIYKSSIRDGKRVRINKTDADIIKLYQDYIRPINEDETHQPREPYINKVEYTKSYKNNVMMLRHTKPKNYVAF
mgnify:CR=1 FL=1